MASFFSEPPLTRVKTRGSIGVFDSRKFEFTWGSITLSYSLSSYLHIGFFLAAIASILAFISLLPVGHEFYEEVSEKIMGILRGTLTVSNRLE